MVWSGCSSLAHGDQFGTLGLLDNEIMARATVRGRDMAMTRITGNVSNLYWTTFAAVWMVEEGFVCTRHAEPRTPDRPRPVGRVGHCNGDRCAQVRWKRGVA
ncbi:hypothetical protein GCM10010411_92750 [Actinomadura fulvescens]|uniref:Uncharacterized protein n=1 Tax=Actinomadura fulvescens TaxID=46160 RepID=A0ABP6D866_9ACTN